MDSVVKRQLIETAATDGKCYLRLLSSFKGFKSCSGKNLESALVLLIRDLGSYPMNFEILGNLAIANWLMQGKTVDEIMDMTDEERDSDTVKLLEEMLESSTRFGFQTTSQSTSHITYYNSNAKFSEEIFNEDGYSARFIISQLSQSTVRMGSAIDFDALFEDQGFSPITQTQVEEYDNRNFVQDNLELLDEVTSKDRENEQLRQELEQLKLEIQTNVSKRTVTNAMMAADLSKLSKKTYQSTILPDDSSSNVDRYDRNFLEEGTILTVTPKHRSTQQLTRIEPPVVEKNYVVGYKKTSQMVQEETKINNSMRPINGLANPFKDSRLNFLCHFDSAMEELKLEDPSMTIYKMFTILNDYKAETPSQELIYQMITKTFDLKRGIVIANPFGLPFVQVGMHISEASLVKTFDLIRTEYRMKWFDSMKNLRVPKFHSEYHNLTDLRITRRSKPKSTGSSKPARQRDKQSKKDQTQSILGFPLVR